jgi:hypothetical protein
VGGLDSGTAIQLAEDVAHVHVHRAGAEEEPLGDLAVGPPYGHEAYDLESARPSGTERRYERRAATIGS